MVEQQLAGRAWAPQRTRTLGITVGAAVAALALSGCSNEVPIEELEQSIRAEYAALNTPLNEIDCPEALPADEGAVLICQVSFIGPTPGGHDYDRVRVSVVEVTRETVHYDLALLGVGLPDDAPVDGEDTEAPTESPDTGDVTDAPTESP